MGFQQAGGPRAGPPSDAGAREAASRYMYLEPPQGDISLEEFDRFARDRLEVLRALEDLRTRGAKREEIVREGLDKFKTHIGDDEAKDRVSHYVLRLAFSRTEDDRQWLLRQEVELFKCRLDGRNHVAAGILASVGDDCEPLTRGEYAQVKGDLLLVMRARRMEEEARKLSIGDDEASRALFYKIPFYLVPELVARREVLVRGGVAFLSWDQLVAVLASKFRSELSKSLSQIGRRWGSFNEEDEKERLVPIIQSLPKLRFGAGADYTSAMRDEDVTVHAIPALAHQHFPLCMFNMYDHLHRNRHLKHQGRRQLGLFLKGIGLPLEQALAFWRQEFSPKCTGEAFDKQYAYNIRHSYGKEGKRADYTPLSCMTVIPELPNEAAGEMQGCPFRWMARDALSGLLTRYGVPAARVPEIVAKAAEGHAQIACGMTFEGKNGCERNTCDGARHPNEYYRLSRDLEKLRMGEGPATPSPGKPSPGPEALTITPRT